MKTHVILIMIAALIIGPSYLSGTVGAQDIKARMKERLPVVEALKTKGVVGENSKGFLEFVGGQQEKPEVVKAENEDRAVVYAEIAAKTQVAVELVGKRRAVQLRELAKPGDWLQNDGGEWYRK